MLHIDLRADALPVALEQSGFVSLERGAWRAHQVRAAAGAQPLEICFADNAAVKDPDPPGAAVLALHRLEHLLERAHIGAVARKDFVGKGEAFWRHDQRQNDLFAIGPMITAVTAPRFVHLRGVAFKIGAR